jgi:hypothetical protein
MEKQTTEHLVEIAQRVPPSDRWKVKNVDIVQNSLTEALESYYMVADIKPKSFILDLEKGKIFIIVTSEQEVKIPEPKKFNIYGE